MNDDYSADVNKIGLYNYPIFDESYRATLNNRILMRFWMREIGVETTSLFRHHMNMKMQEIMPVMNQFYLSTRMEYDPLETVNLESFSTAENIANANSLTNSSGSNDSVSNSKARVVSSQFPQTQLSEIGDYATSAQDSVSDSTASGTSDETANAVQDSTQTGETTSTTKGRQAPAAGLIMLYREAIINVDRMVLDELEPLFMQIMTTHDSYTEPSFPNIPFFNYPLW